LIALPMVPGAFLFKFIRTKRIENFPVCRKVLSWVGVFPLRDHYYEPLIRPEALKHALSVERNLPGIDWNVAEQLELLRSLRYGEELESLSSVQSNPDAFRINNESFISGDFEYWYSIIRHRKPRRIIEVGSGNSTLLAKQAIQKNQELDPEYSCEHTCIEPYEWPVLERLGINVVRTRVEEVDPKLFQTLQSGDILFIDSSHMIRPQGDVLFEILEILPQLAEGVLVHVHDIFSPRDYLERWVCQEMRFWNEQYLLEAFLTCNREWKIVGALNFLCHHHYDALKASCPFLTSDREPGSFYLEKRSKTHS
jgi:hypothetical protein